MKKTKLFNRTAVLAFLGTLFLFSACKQYKASLEEYLSYWSSQAYISSMHIDSNVLIDEQGFSSISSEADLSITLTLQNPKKFEFIMPSAGETRQIVYFSQPEGAGLSDYSLNQIDGNTLKLNLKSGFLKKHEWGKEISPTITLYSTDGRKFNKTYDFTLRANTPPPSPKAVLAKSKDGKYVICIEVPDMNKNTGSGLLHKDLSKIFIDDSYYDFSVNDTQNGFNKPEDHSFINASDTVKLEGGGELPTSNWVLYYKTSVQVGGEKISYKIYLKDSKGLTSPQIIASTALNKVSPVKLKYGGKEILENNESTPFEIGTSSGETITLIATSDTPGATIYVKKTKLPDVTGETSDGPSSLDIKLRREGLEEPTYKLVLYATADNFADSEVRTYYIKLTDTVTINGSDSNAWKTLKEEAEKPSGPSTIVINGEIKATKDEGNNGEITVKRNITIKGNTGSDTDKLNANKDTYGKPAHRIFNVDSGKKLTLENLTLQNGKAGSGASGGGIFVNSSSTLAMTNVTIENCSFQDATSGTKGGGIYSKGTVTMQNSTIQGCSAKEGGGVYVDSGSVTMTGGSIKGCTATGKGGGVWIQNGAVTVTDSKIGGDTSTEGNKAETAGGGVGMAGGSFTMSGASKISNNSVTNGNGGGVHVEAGGTFNMQGGTITNCTATGNGKGVHVASGGTFAMSGSAKVDQNNDVYLPTGTKITVNGALNLQGGKAACITPQTYTDGTKVLDGSAVGSEHGKFIVTPEGTTEWSIDSSGNLTKINHTVTFSVDGGQGGTLTANYGSNPSTTASSNIQVPHGASVNFTAIPDTDWEVEKWTVSPGSFTSGGNPGNTNATLTVTAPATVKVKFKKKTYVVTFKVDGGQGSLKGEYNSTSQTASGSETKTLTVSHGASVNFTAIPDTDWEVEKWTVSLGSFTSGGNPGNTNATLMVTAPATVKVKFKKKTYVVTFKVDGGQGGSLKGTYNGSEKIASGGAGQNFTVQHGGNVTFTATPTEGWIVESWTGVTAMPPNGTTVTLSNVTAPATVTVKFKDNIEISGNTSGAWKALKEEAAKPNGASTIIINGTIKATGGADSGQIDIGRSLTIKPKSGAAELDANQQSGIFKVGSTKTLTLKDGVTLKNGKAGSGGGVHVEAGGTFNMQGGTITACTATEGKGVHVASGSTFKMSDSAKVDENNDVYLAGNSKITVNGALTHKPAAKITPADYTEGRVLATGTAAEKANFKVSPDSSGKSWRYKKVGDDIKFVKGKLTVTFDKIISIKEHDGTTDAEYYWTLKVDNKDVHVLTHHHSWKPKKHGKTYNINKSGEAIVFDSNRTVQIYFLIKEEDHSSGNDDDIVADTTKTISYDYDRDCLKFEGSEIHLNGTKDFIYYVRSSDGDVDVYYSIKWEDNP
ncbi:right-handed parallel beta-helix repeat-containing protein [Treponema pedis]|uniref:Right-handed parallel beta-helix repeat-containing protein n=1 Tax=Treponema pedis TaxID=409322 RepID=A0A7S7AW62_9SPIR|nr:right-handed parallel beta-helix repeat-containing protein [Treponema pedis]QOW60562.1 right-handed parallel beta-helix repeat-containing protein [Treponema pedis]